MQLQHPHFISNPCGRCIVCFDDFQTQKLVHDNLWLDDFQKQKLVHVKAIMCYNCMYKCCIDCVIESFKNQVNTITHFTKFHCPTCEILYSDTDVKRIISDQQFWRLVNYRRNSHSSASVFCQHNNCFECLDDTISKSRLRNGKIKHVMCQACNTSVCIKCGNKDHLLTNTKCINKRSKSFKESRTFFKITVALNPYLRKCPGCRIPTSKNTGCSHMRCSSCDIHWCWICSGTLHIYANNVRRGGIFGKGCQCLTYHSRTVEALCITGITLGIVASGGIAGIIMLAYRYRHRRYY